MTRRKRMNAAFLALVALGMVLQPAFRSLACGNVAGDCRCCTVNAAGGIRSERNCCARCRAKAASAREAVGVGEPRPPCPTDCLCRRELDLMKESAELRPAESEGFAPMTEAGSGGVRTLAIFLTGPTALREGCPAKSSLQRCVALCRLLV